MPSTTYPFTTPGNYTLSNTEVTSGTGNLLLTDLSGQSFTEDFANDTGFTYDSAKAEFTGGLVRQIDQRPANALLYSSFDSTENANWASGSNIGTLNGSATVSGGVLNLDGGGTGNYVEYDGTSNMPSGNTGCVRFTFTPNYSGSPGTNRYLFASSAAESDIDNMIRLIHTGLNIRIDIYNNAGASVHTSQTGNTFNPIASQSYEIEFNWDTTAGEHRLLIDGVVTGGLKTGTGTLGARGIMRCGQDYTGSASPDLNGKIDNLITFDSVQHTGNYTPGQAIPPNVYEESIVELPAFSYSGLGSIQSYQSMTTTEANNPRYHINIGGSDLYWNGSAWSPSDGSYSQSNDQATFSSNLPSLSASGDNTPIVKAVFQANQTNQGSVDNLVLNYTGQQYFTTGTLLVNSAFYAADITSFSATEVEPGTDEVKYAFRVDGVDKYWNGSAWTNSNLTEAQTNDLATVQSNIGTLLAQNSEVKPVVLLKSNNTVSTTPEIDEITVNYDFGANQPNAPQVCSVYGFLLDAFGNAISGATVTFTVVLDDDEYAEAASHLIMNLSTSVTTDATGFFSKDLIRSSEFEAGRKYSISVEDASGNKIRFLDGDTIEFTVPDSVDVNITNQITAV